MQLRNTYFFQISTILLGYLSVLYLYWTPANSAQFRYSSFVIWFMISLYLSNALGTYPIIVFCSLQLMYLVGFIYEIVLILDHHEISGKRTSFMDVVRFALTNVDISTTNASGMPPLLEDESLIVESEKNNEKEDETREIPGLPSKPFLKVTGRSLSMDSDVGKTTYNQPTRRVRSANNISSNRISISDRYFLKKLRAELRMSLDLEDNNVDTDKYWYGAMYACIGMILWKNKWILVVLSIPVVYYYLKQLNSYFGIGKTILDQCYKILNSINSWCQERHEALIPVNIKGLYKVSIIVDQKMTQILKGSIDAVATTAVIMGLIVFVICASIFITIQVR